MTRTRATSKREWSGVGEGDLWVELNGRHVEMRRTIEASTKDGRLVVRLAAVPPGKYVLTGVEFRGSAEEPVDSRELRVTLSDVIAEVARLFTIDPVQTRDGISHRSPTVAESRQLTRRTPKRSLTPEFLTGRVLPVVREAEADGKPTGPRIAEAFDVSQSTARNWLRELRRLDFQ